MKNKNNLIDAYVHVVSCVVLALIFTLLFAIQADASGFSSSPTGFEKVAKDIHGYLDGFVGTTIAIVGGGMSMAALARGWNAGVIAGGIGTALAAAEGPDLLLSLSGAAIF